MKRRSDSSLAKLNEEQLSDLYDWLSAQSYEAVIARAAKPAPEGFGIKFGRTPLHRFYQEEQGKRRAERIAELAVQAGDGPMPPEVARVWMATRVEVAHATYDIASTNCAPGGAGGANYDRVERALHRFEMVDLGRQSRQLEKERMIEQRRQWQFDAARKALDHAALLQKVAADPVLDNQDKIWAAHGICFGPDSEPESPNPSLVPGSPAVPAVQSGVSPAGPNPLAATNPQFHTASHSEATAIPSLNPSSEKSAPSAVKESETLPPSPNTPHSAIANPQSAPVPADPNSEPPVPPSVPKLENLEPDNIQNPHSTSTQLHTASHCSTSATPFPYLPSEKSEPSAVEESATPPRMPNSPHSLAPQTKSASRWMRETKQRELMKQYLIDHACGGDSDQFHPLVRSGTPITIDDLQILRELA